MEDNDINQQVGRELLEDAGMRVEVAENGLIALEMVRRSPYDLVFMDMQMPVMDGVTATREIRANPALSTMPIVAMTANAMEQDRRRCRDAGMDDFLVKPIDPKELAALLLRLLHANVAGAGLTPEPPQRLAGTSGQVPSDVPGLNTALGLARMLNKKPLYLEMLRRYAIGQKDTCTQIRSALSSGDVATAERLAHTTRGVSGSIGACAVEEHAMELETVLRDRRPMAEVEPLISCLAEPLAALVRNLEASLPPATKFAGDPALSPPA